MNLYLHFPFCQQKCFYCDFLSFSKQEHLISQYVDSLIREITIYHRILPQINITTIYLGGGTPSLLESKDLNKIFTALCKNLHIAPNAEITIEANPDSLTQDKLTAYLQIGINRLSMGVQAWQDDLLQLIGRTYQVETVQHAYSLARKVGFTNINLDLMFSLPTQQMTQWQSSLREVIALKPEHLACYSLELDNYSVFAAMTKNHQLAKISEHLDRQMYHYACQTLRDADYHQYEISNFAKTGFACQHNLDFWHSQDYLGLGLGASSKIGVNSWQNSSQLQTYCQKLQVDQLAIANKITLSRVDERKSLIALALRTKEGINKQELLERFNWSITSKRRRSLDQLIAAKLVKENEAYIYLTNKGLDLLNQAIIRLI